MLRAGRERARRGRRRDERGAALVEAVIIFPVIMLLTFGAIEFGMGFSQKGGLESISRTGARTGATLAADATTDILIGETPDNSIGVETVQAVNAALDSSSLPDMKRVVVYRIDNIGPGSVVDYGPAGWGDPCGAYCMAFTFNPSGEFNVGTAGTWPIAAREACGPHADRIGVRIEGEFQFLTGLVGTGPIEMTAQSVVQLEPTSAC